VYNFLYVKVNVGLTEPGQSLLSIVERMLVDADNIKRLADDFNKVDEGTLTIATTHTQARYVLPPIVNQFKKLFPKYIWFYNKQVLLKSQKCYYKVKQILVSQLNL
jgi:DNA-binding transcriptional LysR family regulator